MSVVTNKYNARSGKNSVRINESIKADKIRVVGSDGSMLGVLSPYEALQIAQGEGLDLVEVSPNASPAVCKIIDFGKYKYEISKKLHDAKKNRKKVDTKEVKMRPNIDSGDYAIKLQNTKKFISEGHRVKVCLVFRGREIAHTTVGKAVIEQFRSDIEGIAKVEVAPKMEGRQIFMILTPLQKINQ